MTMPHLIIGHTTHDSVRLWVGGEARHAEATVFVTPAHSRETAPPIRSATVRLYGNRGRTTVFPITGLRPDTDYDVTAACTLWPRWGISRSTVESAVGRFRTFPHPSAAREATSFRFLFGSCNLSTAKLTNLAALAVSKAGGIAGSMAMGRPADRWRAPGFRRLAKPLSGASFFLPDLIRHITGSELARPLLPSPFAEMAADIDAGSFEPRFMIHAGDQIYFDFPFPSTEPVVEEYRRAYRNAWFDDDHLARVLASLPQYMTLDDHELVDGFANDRVPLKDYPPKAYRYAGTTAYREFVHGRHRPYARGERGGPDVLYHDFDYSGASFFLLDTRTERHISRGEMISAKQRADLQEWLLSNRDRVKFVVSSVPFIARIRSKPGETVSRASTTDRWAGGPFEPQRREILDFIYREGIDRLVFLVGDMHCSFHADLTLGTAEGRIVLHELAGGPIHQLDFSRMSAFEPEGRGTLDDTPGGIPFHYRMRAFHNSSNAMLDIQVDERRGRATETNVSWQLLRMRSQPQPDAARRGLFVTQRPGHAGFRNVGTIAF